MKKGDLVFSNEFEQYGRVVRVGRDGLVYVKLNEGCTWCKASELGPKPR